MSKNELIWCKFGHAFWQKKKEIHNYKWHNSATLYFRTKACSNYSDRTDAIKSSVSSSTSLLFIPQDHLKCLCLLLVLQNKQRQAELEQWLENQQILNRTWAHGPLGQIRFFGKGESMRLKNEGWMWGGWKDQRCELWADRAASLNLVYHNRHGNITSIFFSLQDQSLYNPSKQHWNNSLFALCGLGLQGPLCCSSQCSVKVETIFSLIVKWNSPHASALLIFFCVFA